MFRPRLETDAEAHGSNQDGNTSDVGVDLYLRYVVLLLSCPCTLIYVFIRNVHCPWGLPPQTFRTSSVPTEGPLHTRLE